MKVLIFTTAYEPLIGGSEIAIAEIARHLPDISFDILTPRYSRATASREEKNNVIIHRLGFGSLLDKFLFPIFGFFKGLQLSAQASILHAYQVSYGAITAYLVSLVISRPLILTLQEGKQLENQNLFIRLIRRFLIPRADQITAISPYLANYAKTMRSGNSVAIIPNGVSTSFFQEASQPQEPIVISVSRLVPKNGLENLIVAMKQVPAMLWLVGEGSQRNYLEKFAQDRGITNVIFKGAVPHHDLPQLLSRASLFARPSLSEGLGSAFLEAMASGVPVIGSPVGGIPMFLKHEKTGLLCNPHDPDNIAEAINRLLSDDILREKVRTNAQSLVRLKFKWETIAQRMAEVYRSL